MAITKLLNIKENKKGTPSSGLYGCINYILNEEKTKEHLWVGGNCGTEVQDVYQTMLETKRSFEKMNGRQGYHFILSFQPGEVNAEQAYRVVNEFCEKYLRNDYDYVFAIHDDREHLHGHICFNSISRTTGYKYRYEPGDWEKYIQPITDRVCENHGLEKLKYEEQRVGKSYGEHLAEKEKRMTWKKIIQMDIDVAIQKSNSFDDFLEQMKRQGYDFRFGKLKEHGNYMTFYAPGAERGRRDRSLGEGYTLQDIRKRILTKEKIPDKKTYQRFPNVKNFSEKKQIVGRRKIYGKYQVCKIRRVFRARNYHYFNPYAVDQGKVRKDLLHIQRLSEECRLIIHNNIRTENDAKQFYRELRKGTDYSDSDELQKQKRTIRRILREFQQEKENDLLITKGVTKRNGKRK